MNMTPNYSIEEADKTEMDDCNNCSFEVPPKLLRNDKILLAAGVQSLVAASVTLRCEGAKYFIEWYEDSDDASGWIEREAEISRSDATALLIRYWISSGLRHLVKAA